MKKTLAVVGLLLLSAVAFAFSPKHAIVTHDFDQLHLSGVPAFVSYQTEILDKGNLHSNTSNPQAVNVTVTGTWRVQATVTYEANSTGDRTLKIRKIRLSPFSITEVAVLTVAAAQSGPTTLTISPVDVQADAGFYFDTISIQTSGVNLNLVPDPIFDVERVQ